MCVHIYIYIYMWEFSFLPDRPDLSPKAASTPFLTLDASKPKNTSRNRLS